MSYLHEYETYALGDECPPMFHTWVGLMTLSAAVQRKVWLPFGDNAFYPNIYVMLVGDAGNGKTWAMKKGVRVMKELNLPISGSIETAPGMWRYMGGTVNSMDPAKSIPAPENVKHPVKWPDGKLRDTHCITIVANEFINFISYDQEGWVNSLNDIYDEDNYHYRTKGSGEDTLLGPYICLLGALTTDVAADLQKTRIISTGLARRTIFQYGQRMFDKPVAIIQFSPEQLAAKAWCVDYLKQLNDPKVAGEFQWGPGTKEWFIAWYGPELAQVPTRHPTVRSWYASKSTQLLKLAMLISLSQSFNLTMEIDHLELALAYLSSVEVDLPKIFGAVGRNEMAGIAVKIMEFVEYLPDPITEQKLRNQFYGSCKTRDEYDGCITYLKESGQLCELTLVDPKNQNRHLMYCHPKVLNVNMAKIRLAGRYAVTCAELLPPPQLIDLPESPSDSPAASDPSVEL